MQTASTNICERMGYSQELSEFQRGTVTGCHLCNKSSREISSLLSISQSTVSGIITKWKRLGTTATQPRSGRPRKMTERGQRMLRCIVSRGHQRGWILSQVSLGKKQGTPWTGQSITVWMDGWMDRGGEPFWKKNVESEHEIIWNNRVKGGNWEKLNKSKLMGRISYLE